MSVWGTPFIRHFRKKRALLNGMPSCRKRGGDVMKLRRNKIWAFAALCNPPTQRFPETEAPYSTTWRLLGCGPPLDGKIISVSINNLMSIPIDPVPPLYVYFHLCSQTRLLGRLPYFLFLAKVSLFDEKCKEFRKKIPIPCIFNIQQNQSSNWIANDMDLPAGVFPHIQRVRSSLACAFLNTASKSAFVLILWLLTFRMMKFSGMPASFR